jgi:hypothetical protein
MMPTAATLWDLLKPIRRVIVPRHETIEQSVRRRVSQSSTAVLVPRRPRIHMQDRYDALVEEMKRLYNLRVRKWRKSSSGVAWLIRYRSGKIVKLIEAPYPRGPMSCAIFMHEVGHHAIGLGVYKPRCFEEYQVWLWALREMRERGFNVTPAVEKRMHDSMRYAVAKARRRGLRNLPEELMPYAHP